MRMLTWVVSGTADDTRPIGDDGSFSLPRYQDVGRQFPSVAALDAMLWEL